MPVFNVGTANPLDLNTQAGSTFILNCVWLQGDTATSPPVDVTGYLATMTVRLGYEGPAVITLTQDDGIALGGTDGTITITIPADTLAAIEPIRYRWELVMQAGPAGDYTALLKGFFQVSPAVVINT